MARRPDPDEQDTGTRTCPPCSGTGARWNDHAQSYAVCGLCNGQGRITRTVYDRYMALPSSARQ